MPIETVDNLIIQGFAVEIAEAWVPGIGLEYCASVPAAPWIDAVVGADLGAVLESTELALAAWSEVG